MVLTQEETTTYFLVCISTLDSAFPLNGRLPVSPFPMPPNQVIIRNPSYVGSLILSPAREASMEVANLTERKYTHPPVYGVKEFVCLSVCLLQILT